MSYNSGNTKDMLNSKPNFVISKRYLNRLDWVVERYPDGCPDHVIAACLDLSEAELEQKYQQIIACLKREMGV